MKQLATLLPTIRACRQRRATLPRLLTYIVTFACNARCVMCDSWQKPKLDELGLDELESIFRQMPRLDAVRLTGGEPFMRQDFADIAGLVTRHLRPRLLHITTNGFLTDRIVEYCERRDRRQRLYVLVSIDGIAGKHDDVRGVANAWKFSVATVTRLARAARDWNLQVSINQTITDAESARQYPELRDMMRELGVGVRPVLAYEASATYDLAEAVVHEQDGTEYSDFGQLSRAELLELFETVERDLRRWSWSERLTKGYYIEGLKNRLLHGTGSPNPPCVALSAHMRLLPDGRVPTCHFNSTVVGNLRSTSFDELWSQASTEKQRDWVRACPGCWAECEVLPSATYTGDLLAHAARRRRKPAIAPDPVSTRGEPAV